MLRSPNRVTWHDDTLRQMASWATRRYRLGRVEIVWRSKIVKSENGGVSSGCTTCLDKRPPFYIELLESRTHEFLVQVLAHELAHCVAIRRHGYIGHGRKFVKIVNELIFEWNELNIRRDKRDDRKDQGVYQ